MAGLDPSYIVGINLGEVFVDNTTGLALSGGEIFFYQDSARSIPKTVYELTGSPPNYTYSALPNPITLSAVGTIVNNSGTNVAVYYHPYDAQGDIQNYFVLVKSADGVRQFEREAWPNVTPTSSPSGEGANTTQNEISNSQFVDITFPTDTGLEISWTGALSETTYTIGPDWDLVIEASGTGMVTVSRNAIAGSLNVITNPPFVLEFIASSVNITTLKLVQRLYNNPDIWANQYVSGNMVVEALDGISRTFSMVYAPSISVASTTILTGASGAIDPLQLFGSVLIPSGTNSEDGDTGYVDIEIVLPTAGNYSVTSIQVTSGDEEPDDAQAVEYQEQPTNRQQDFSFHHYRPQIVQLAVPSILQGWDFRVNPSQWGAIQSVGAVASEYVWDQTIIFQDTNNAISVNRNAQNVLRTIVGTACQFALIQYLEISDFMQMIQSNFSTLITALTDISGGVTGTVSFWATTDASLPDAGANLSLVASLDANGKPETFNGAWTEIARSTGWDAKFTIPEQDEYGQIPLEGWNSVSLITGGTYTYVAIVVGFSQTDTGVVDFQSISVTPTLIASPVASLSAQLTLNQLQRYYEKSYGNDVPGAVTNTDAIWALSEYSTASSNGSHVTVSYCTNGIFFNYKGQKRIPGNILIYSPSGVINAFQGTTLAQNGTGTVIGTTDLSISNWFATASINSTSSSYIAAKNIVTPISIHAYASAADSNTVTMYFLFHYTIDSRLGIV